MLILSWLIMGWMAASYLYKVGNQPLVTHLQKISRLVTIKQWSIHGNIEHCSFWEGNIYFDVLI